MRVDIHVHSKHSKRPNQWILKKIGCAESYTEPLQLYQIAKSKGMTHVTITDHNTIEGVLEIAHLADTFISEEITTYFPQDRCKVHVLAINISEVQHHDIQKVRNNIFDLSRFFKEQNILAIVAHPLYAINERLTVAHFEQMLLLFRHFELNGARNDRENACLRKVAHLLNEETINRIAETYNITPMHHRPWQIQLWGGSDDHSSLNIARTYTTLNAPDGPQSLRADAQSLEPQVSGPAATPLTMAHNLYGIAYQYYRNRFALSRYTDKDVLMRFLDRNLCAEQCTHPGLVSRLYLMWQYHKVKKARTPVSDSLLALLRYELARYDMAHLLHDNPDLFLQNNSSRLTKPQEQDWFDFVNLASKSIMRHFGNHLLDHLSGANIFNVFSTIGSAGGLYTLLAPYFVAYAQFAKDRAFSEKIDRHFAARSSCDPGSPPDQKEFRLAHFSDTFYEVNGVAHSLQQQVFYALKNHKAYTLITCHATQEPDRPGVRNFTPIGTYEMPEYPELQIFYPPFLEMLAYCYEGQFDQIHTATPGPVGLVALAIAKILKVPISGTYHTAIPQYVRILTGDEDIEDLTWKYVLWYYGQLDVIYAPSRSTMDELVEKGLDPKKITLYPRGIDIGFFNPAKRNGIFQHTFPLAEGIKLLYVGRVSKEKNLDLLTAVFQQLIRENHNVQLVIVGDGPYLNEMKAHMKGLPCCFTGYLKGQVLAAVYASADIFVFPSTTDTFGNVVLEAQASGLPVIVSDQGGPCENMINEKTGLICRAHDAQNFCRAVSSLICDLQRRQSMSLEARRYVEERSFENAFLQLWDLFQNPMPEFCTRSNDQHRVA